MRIQAKIHMPIASRWRHIQESAAHFNALGIEFVDSNPDVIIGNYQAITPSDIASDIPIIVLARQDASSIYHPPHLELADKPSVIALFQNHLVDPRDLANECASRYHYLLISKHEKLPPPAMRDKPLSQETLNKCHQVLWDYESSLLRFQQSGLYSLDVDCSAPRSFDIHCVLNGDPKLQRDIYFDSHRESAVRQIARIPKVKVFGKQLGDQGLTWQEYISGMLSSKVCVSPWGFGEYCHRDLEALLCGCVLVKPDTSFVKTEPDFLRREDTYVRCRADYSDLQEKVEEILQNWVQYEEWRRANRALFTNHPLRNNEHFAKYFVDKVQDALGSRLN